MSKGGEKDAGVGQAGGDWARLDRASLTLLEEVARMVDALASLPPLSAGQLAAADLARSRLLVQHQRLSRHLTALLEEVVQLASAGVAGAAQLLSLGAGALTAADHAQQLQASRVLERLTRVSEQVMLARRQVKDWIACLEGAGDADAAADHQADDQAWERARMQTADLLERLRPG